MAYDLKLDVTAQDDGSIRVAWNDAVKGISSPRSLIFTGCMIVMVGLVEVSDIYNIVDFDPYGMQVAGVFISGLIFGFLWVLFDVAGTSTVPNKVTFSPTEIRHEDNAFPTERVTRLDYGAKASLTGNQKHHGSLIRLWIDDAQVFTLSENDWEGGINHQIHATLTKALESVREHDKQQEHAEKFGVVDSDTGMPDY